MERYLRERLVINLHWIAIPPFIPEFTIYNIRRFVDKIYVRRFYTNDLFDCLFWHF